MTTQKTNRVVIEKAKNGFVVDGGTGMMVDGKPENHKIVCKDMNEAMIATMKLMGVKHDGQNMTIPESKKESFQEEYARRRSRANK